VAKAGMAAINYDPNNGYVDNWMFGHGIALHSVIGDLWAQAGLLGLCFTALVLAVTVYAVLSRMASNVASALLVYVCLKTSWNLFFGPWYSSMLILVLALALGMVERTRSSRPARGVPG
jgi:O-antigen ligase